MSEKELHLVGGANGAGKTTFVRQLIAERGLPYLGADAIAAELAPDDPASVRIEAGREFVRRLGEHLDTGASFIVESTLSGRTLQRALESASARGFRIYLTFVFLDRPDTSVARVQQRVTKGGHDVPEADIRRRFSRSLANFCQLYRPMTDAWTLVYNGGSGFEEVASGGPMSTFALDDRLLRLFFQLAGLDEYGSHENESTVDRS